jgi:AraC-like DNA-binding protein
MAVKQRRDLLHLHAQLHLRLIHAAIGSYPCDYEKGSLPVNRLLLVFSDSGRDDSYIRDLYNGNLYPMREGNAYFIPCHHIIDQHQTDDLYFVSFQFNLDLFYGFDIMSKFPECRVIADQGLIRKAKELIKNQNLPSALCGINEMIYRLCSLQLEEKPEMLQKKLNNWEQYESLLDFVEKHGNAATTVAMLAEMMERRQDVFSRKFTRDMGIAPKEFITNTLIRKASKMLLNPGVNVQSAAKNLNFNSEYYFSRFFKKHTGMAPSSFKKSNGI